MTDDETGKPARARKARRAGQVDGTFNKIAPDFDRATCTGVFSSSQLLLIQQAREEAWTKAALARSKHAFPFRLNLSAIARARGMSRPSLSKQFASLVEWKVFVPVGDGSYELENDFRLWVGPRGLPLLSPADLRWCADALTIWTQRVYPPEDTPLYPPEDTPAHSRIHPLYPPEDTPAHSRIQVQSAPQTPIEDRARQKTLKKTNTDCPEEEREGGNPSPPQRPAVRAQDDREAINEAISLLGSDLRTEHLGLELGRQHNLPMMLPVPGWKFVRAAKVVTGPSVTDRQRRDWKYFMGIVNNTGDDERDAPVRGEPTARPASRVAAKTTELVQGFARMHAEARERTATDGAG